MIDVSRDDLILLTKVASRFNVSYRTAKSWSDSGELETVRLGNSLYTSPDALNAYANREKIDATAGDSEVRFPIPRKRPIAKRQDPQSALWLRMNAALEKP